MPLRILTRLNRDLIDIRTGCRYERSQCNFGRFSFRHSSPPHMSSNYEQAIYEECIGQITESNFGGIGRIYRVAISLSLHLGLIQEVLLDETPPAGVVWNIY